MIYKEYGNENEKTIILMHGGGLSWWGYEAVAKKLADKYHIILPVLDGHGDSQREFQSIENNAENIIKFIDENFNGKIFAIGGLSLGGQVALEIISKRNEICEFAIIESASVIPSKITELLVSPMIKSSYWLINKLWFAKVQFNYLKIRQDLFDEYYLDSCKISKKDMISFLESSSAYNIKPTAATIKSKVIIIAGGKEQGSIKKSAKLINSAIPGSSMELIPGLYHGQLSMNYPEKYISVFDKYVK